MSGSGNDFLFFDARRDPLLALQDPAVVDRVTARATGVGADGVVFLQADTEQDFRIRYLNRDGSIGELCGNASLCTTRLARELGMVRGDTVRFATDAGVISARFVDGMPEIDLQPTVGLRPDAGIATIPGEHRIGFANTGVPHLVVLVGDTDSVDVAGRGKELRHHASLAAGANVNFVAQDGDGHWRIRTFERGVEGETLACGTGAVASGIMLETWGLSGAQTTLETRSGRPLTVTVRHDSGAIRPSLRGEGRIVFVGELVDV
jgi:diaminopimelate epimerase